MLKLEISWNKLQFTGIELKGHRIWFECQNNFFNLNAIIAKLEFTYKHIGRISKKYGVGSIVFIG